MYSKAALSILTILLLTSYSGSSNPVVATINTPTFPSCPNPGGSVIANYPQGTHGIPGDSATYTGSDVVYSIGSNQVVQCFCAPDASGIQTNWWKVSSISQDEIETLRNLDWIFIPDGSAWGLEPVAYMAKNLQYSCSGGSAGSSSQSTSPASAPVCDSKTPPAPTLISAIKNGSQATLTWTKVEGATHYSIYYGAKPGVWDYSVVNTGDVTSFTILSLDPNKTYYYEVRSVNNCAPSASSTGIGGGEVLGASTFAPTGTSTVLFGTTLISMVFLGLFLFAKGRHGRQA